MTDYDYDYDPADPDDPLRHRFLDRKGDGGYVMPLGDKVANGLGVPAERFREIAGDGVHVERVDANFRRRLARMLGIGA